MQNDIKFTHQAQIHAQRLPWQRIVNFIKYVKGKKKKKKAPALKNSNPVFQQKYYRKL